MKTKQIIITLILFTSLFCFVTTGTNIPEELQNEFGEDMLTLALCYELQQLDTGFQDYYQTNKNDLTECNTFLVQWDTDGDWHSNQEELEKGTNPEDETENPSTLDNFIEGEITEEDLAELCVQNDYVCETSHEEECFDYLGDYDIDCLDNDGDGFYNYEEYKSGTNKEDPTESPWWIDLDGDGYRNLNELRANSDCFNEDIMPGWTDTDHDQYSDIYETQVGTDPFDGQDVPEEKPFVGTYRAPETQETKQTKAGWQLYLAITLAVLLIIMLIIYFIYYNKYEEE